MNATGAVTLLFYALMLAVNIIFSGRVAYWKELAAFEIIVIAFVSFINYRLSRKESFVVRQINYWYPTALIFLTYKQLFFMIKPIRMTDYDQLLISVDRFIFHADPTHILFRIANPFLTELLQIVYFSFYLLPVGLAFFLFIEKKVFESEYAVFAVVYGFFVSYIGYFIWPAIGPRFTLHNFYLTDAELPGLFLAEPLRHLINNGGSVNLGQSVTDSFQRDVFPSGHTMITLIVMYLSVKFNCKIKYFLLTAGTLLIFSTVYLRYHYGIDVIAGCAFAVFSLWSGKKLFNIWQKNTGQKEIEY
jgi:membrane-associated phospholipid phosphatase